MQENFIYTQKSLTFAVQNDKIKRKQWQKKKQTRLRRLKQM